MNEKTTDLNDVESAGDTDDFTVEKIMVLAYNWKELPPSELALPERCLWLMLANIYKRFREEDLTKEQGERLKNEAMKTYQADRLRLRELEGCKSSIGQLRKEHAEMWQRIEIAGNQYGMKKTVETADAFYQAVYNVKPKLN